MKQMNKYSAQEYLRSSKNWISEGIKSRLSTDGSQESKESFLASLLFQVELEEVELTTACKSLDIDISTFITIATTWAVIELDECGEKARPRQSSVTSGLGLDLPEVKGTYVLYIVHFVRAFYIRRFLI